MSAVMFDTLKLTKALEGEFTSGQVQLLASSIAESTQDTIATKSDLATLRLEIGKHFSLLRADLVRWIVTSIAFNFVVVTGLVITLVKVFGK